MIHSRTFQRCALLTMLSVLDEMAKVSHGAVGVLVISFESFQGCEPL